MIILHYLSRLIRTWVLWVFLIADAVAFFLGLISDNLVMHRLVYWAIAAAGFLVANIVLFHQQQQEIDGLKLRLDSAQGELGNLVLHVRAVSFQHTAPVLTLKDGRLEDGLDPPGMPIEAIVRARIEVENTGLEAGELVWRLDQDRSDLPECFALNRRNMNGQFAAAPGPLQGRSRWEGDWTLEVFPQGNDPRAFATTLRAHESFRLILTYSTKRVGGDSPRQELPIEGSLLDYRDQLTKRWSTSGHAELASLLAPP